MKIYNYLPILLLLLVASCFKDKGNYDYLTLSQYTVEGFPETMTCLADVERIKATAVVKDDAGNIIDNNKFVFSYQLGFEIDGEIWQNYSKDGGPTIDSLAKLKPQTYKLWLQVYDKEKGSRVASRVCNVTITSSTYEGWMVLCNEGAENRCRMDMISFISDDRQEVAHDIMGNKGLPESKNACCIGYVSSRYLLGDGGDDAIYLVCENDTYKLNNVSFITDVGSTINNTDYLLPSATHRPVVHYNVGSQTGIFNIIVSKEGDAYSQRLGSAGAIFKSAINVDEIGENPTYKVSKYVGFSLARPYVNSMIVFFDETNKRFMNLTTKNPDILLPFVNPAGGALFDYNIGKELVWMGATAFSSGTAYAVVKEGNKRFICGIGVSSIEPTQSYYGEIESTDIDQAELFAFHSQFPFMYYAVGNKVYSYDLQRKSTNLVVTLPVGENVSMLKFNLYNNYNFQQSSSSKVTPEFLAIQYQLIVGSCSSDLVNGGKIGFYKVKNEDNTLQKVNEYTGFAKVKDIVYRERPKRF